METFEHLGFIKEYYIGQKYIGSVQVETGREKVGYEGRETEVLTEPVITDNKKKIKKGTEVMTMIYPMCGKRNLDLNKIYINAKL